MADLKLAFYGCGLIAEHHMVAVKRCQEAGVPVRVVACVDIDATRAAKLCSLSGSDSMDPDPSAMHRDATVDPGWRVTCFLACKPFETYAAAMAAGQIDGCLILLPHDLHEQAAIEVMSTDTHLLIEKPMAPTLKACERMIAAAAAASARTGGAHVFAVAENSSFWPEVVAAKAVLDSGAIGDVVTARAHYYEAMSNKIMDKDESGSAAPKGLDWVDWRSSLDRAGGGVVMDGGAHWLRPLREFLGDPTEAMGVLGRPLPAIEGESMCHALLKFPAGITASYQCTVLGEDGVLSTADPFFRLIGTKGDIVIRGDFSGGGTVYTAEHPEGTELLPPEEGGFVRSYHPQMADFCAACLSGGGSEKLRRSAQYALGELKTTLAIYKSAESGRWEPIEVSDLVGFQRQRHQSKPTI